VEPTWTSQKFILYGTRAGKGVLVHLDFSGLHQAVCRNPDKAGEPDSDYELWSPRDDGFAKTTDDKKCVLGTHTAYTRKKREAKCNNPLEYEPSSKATPCQCKRDDFQCDYCFEAQPDGTCTLACSDYDPAIVPDFCIDYYYVSQGYRLVPGDKCEGGLDLRPVKKPCPGTNTSPSKGNTGLSGSVSPIAVVAIIVVIVGALILGTFIGMFVIVRVQKPEFLYSRLKDIKLFQPSGRAPRGQYGRVGDVKEDESPFLVDEQ